MVTGNAKMSGRPVPSGYTLERTRQKKRGVEADDDQPQRSPRAARKQPETSQPDEGQPDLGLPHFQQSPAVRGEEAPSPESESSGMKPSTKSPRTLSLVRLRRST